LRMDRRHFGNFTQPPGVRGTSSLPHSFALSAFAMAYSTSHRVTIDDAASGSDQVRFLRSTHFAEAAQTLNFIGTLYHSFFRSVASCSTEGRFGVGEVASSNLVVPTIYLNN
jgi:hypothetical protein